MPLLTPFSTVRAPGAMVCSADQLATPAGMAILARGGNAVDAAIATNAAMAVTESAPLRHGRRPVRDRPPPAMAMPAVLDASGRAGRGASSEALRAEGHTEMPFRHDARSVTVPGCVDGWVALHERFGSLDLAVILEPAIRLAEDGFPASPLLVGSLAGLDSPARERFVELIGEARAPGSPIRRPGAGRAMRAVAAHGRAAFYEGEFGEGLLAVGDGVFAPTTLPVPKPTGSRRSASMRGVIGSGRSRRCPRAT